MRGQRVWFRGVRVKRLFHGSVGSVPFTAPNLKDTDTPDTQNNVCQGLNKFQLVYPLFTR